MMNRPDAYRVKKVNKRWRVVVNDSVVLSKVYKSYLEAQSAVWSSVSVAELAREYRASVSR